MGEDQIGFAAADLANDLLADFDRRLQAAIVMLPDRRLGVDHGGGGGRFGPTDRGERLARGR